ncbi:hypothetical protein HYPSUDRAFT_483661 [Hypholoma sublateritium FD-334 SS-4]|uniref:Uncharacterized protein n=1 Tax=Hypholoma sublateritium (strain FD-334 SS-4) TaxID=945553 RepID=A0A0D2NBE3_HYPSF|nr:hypothetical protein HYPSUDRAFT_483661 [Hypholoma sublateritium FD-334 SS-4]
MYAEFWKDAQTTHQLCSMPVFDQDDTVIASPELFQQKLVGSLVEVTFTLKHYHMGANAKRPEAYDTFSAKIESVSILRSPPVLTKSPYKETIYTRKPRPMPQTPTRGEQKSAAKAFVPAAPIPAPDFLQGASTSTSTSIGNPGSVRVEASTTSPAEAVKTRARAREEASGGDDDAALRQHVAKKSKV